MHSSTHSFQRSAFVSAAVLALSFWLMLLPPDPSVAAPVKRSELASLDPNSPGSRPESSLVDYSELLDAPAGKHGFMETHPDGHFYFADGQRARFWGINVAGTSVFQPRPVIDRVVNVLARAGINMVRLHDIDDRGGVIDSFRSDSRHLLPLRLHQLDYWIYRCKQKGIYIYLDLLDYRTFRAGDDVVDARLLGRAAKPYALFSPRLIALQKEYARELLSNHVNRYTGLSYARDPAVCMLELYDENGLFIRRKELEGLAVPYRRELTQLWNVWLRKRYVSTSVLKRAWTDEHGQQAVGPGERLEYGTIRLENLWLHADWDRPNRDPAESPARLNDEARFASDIETRYFLTMKHYLHSLGVRIPITAIGAPDVVPDTRAIAQSLDFTGNNFYWDHPTFRATATWKLPSYFHNKNPLQSVDEFSFAPTLSSIKVRGKPLVLREWNYCWPNPYRSAGMLEAAVYGCLQDVDAMILFTYDTDPRLKSLSYFDVSHDPERWYSVGPLAAVFLRRLVSPARNVVDIGYSDQDVFHYYGYSSSVYGVAWESRVEAVFFDHSFPDTGADLVVASGRSGSAAYPGQHVLIRTNDRLSSSVVGWSSSGEAGQSGYTIGANRAPAGIYSSWGNVMPPGTERALGEGIRFRVGEVRARGFTPIGVSPDGLFCQGFYDPVRQNYTFEELNEVDTLRVALGALRQWRQTPSGPGSVHRDRFVSDTGELIRDSATGVLRVITPSFEAIAGNIRPDVSNGEGHLRVHAQSNSGTMLALTLDGGPLVGDRDLLLLMQTRAANTGQVVRWPGGGGSRLELDAPGGGPIRTFGEPIFSPTQVWVGNSPIASVYVQGGTWMVAQFPSNCTVYCDTPQVKVDIARFPSPTILEPSGGEEVVASAETAPGVTLPTESSRESSGDPLTTRLESGVSPQALPSEISPKVPAKG